MKLNLSDKNIHIGAIATFYIIALLVRLISLLVVNKFPLLFWKPSPLKDLSKLLSNRSVCGLLMT
jgi:hypothetical protein